MPAIIQPITKNLPQNLSPLPQNRHARACRGHPRLACSRFAKKGVDGRDKPGHDENVTRNIFAKLILGHSGAFIFAASCPTERAGLRVRHY
jgi:hypothetical protein